MNCSIQNGALYMLAGIPMLHGTADVVHPSILLWTSSCLAVGYAVWRAFSRRQKLHAA